MMEEDFKMFETTSFAFGLEFLEQTGQVKEQYKGVCEVCRLKNVVLISENERICHTCAEGMFGEEEPDY